MFWMCFFLSLPVWCIKVSKWSATDLKTIGWYLIKIWRNWRWIVVVGERRSIGEGKKWRRRKKKKKKGEKRINTLKNLHPWVRSLFLREEEDGKKGFFSVNGSKSWMQMQRDPLLTIKRWRYVFRERKEREKEKSYEENEEIGGKEERRFSSSLDFSCKRVSAWKVCVLTPTGTHISILLFFPYTGYTRKREREKEGTMRERERDDDEQLLSSFSFLPSSDPSFLRREKSCCCRELQDVCERVSEWGRKNGGSGWEKNLLT